MDGKVLTDRIGQEWIDQINTRLFLAIAQDNLNEVIEAVTMGGLINANDRFWSPSIMLLTKGTHSLLIYLLRHGGNPNTQGNHLSTPLHSVTGEKIQRWLNCCLKTVPRSMPVQTNWRPLMTATLRGQLQNR